MTATQITVNPTVCSTDYSGDNRQNMVAPLMRRNHRMSTIVENVSMSRWNHKQVSLIRVRILQGTINWEIIWAHSNITSDGMYDLTRSLLETLFGLNN